MLLLFTLLGCDPAARATDLCRTRRDTLDQLYTRYGGSDVAQGLSGGVLGNAVGEADRQDFERKCLMLGAGGHPTFLADKGKEFFAQPETVKACQKAVDLENEVKKLNRELPANQQVTCP